MWTHRSFLFLILHLAETTRFALAAAEPAEPNREEAAPEVLPLIIGGTVAELGQYPYYVQMFLGYPYTECGGSLIAPNVVLTAAHCVKPNTTSIKAYSVEKGSCAEWFLHPQWDSYTYKYDFALCRLENPVEIDDSEVFLELNKDPGFPSEDADDVMIEAMGMGCIELVEEKYPKVLMRTDLTLLDNATCKQRRRKKKDFYKETMMCSDAGNSATCYGDSGGPVVVVSPSSGGRTRHTQIGVVSWGSTRSRINVDARVSSGIDWIQTVVCDDWGIEDAASLCETLSPSPSPSDSPTAQPSAPPSDSPSVLPSASPSDSPSEPPSTIKSGKNGKKARKKTKKKKNTKENKKGD